MCLKFEALMLLFYFNFVGMMNVLDFVSNAQHW